MCNHRLIVFVFLLLVVFSGCQEKSASDTLFVKLSSRQSGITFKNLLRESDEFNVLTYGYFYNGGGIAVGDINNDGLEDIFFTGNMKSSHLYLNQGDMKFKDIAEDAGITAEGLWNTGVTMADVNNDGYLDIYISRSAAALAPRRSNQLYINNRDLTFTEAAQMYGLDDTGYGTQAVFFDYDKDGDLDMYCLNHSVQQYAGFGKNLSQFKQQQDANYGDKLYRNDQFEEQGVLIGRFTDVTSSTGINSTVLGFGLGVAIVDANQDTWPDIYVSNDYNEEDYLYINQKDGTFVDSITSMTDVTSLFSMGSDVADVNGDGLMDILSLDMLPESHQRIMMTSGADNYNKKQALYQSGFHFQSMRNMLQVNNGNGTFSEIGQLAGISNTDWSWAAQFGDVDLDGDQDLFISNGYKADYTNMDFMSYAMDQQISNQQTGDIQDLDELIENIPAIEVSNYIYENDGKGIFTNKTKEWGIESPSMTNGAVLADLDNDGDLDLITNNINEVAAIYENTTSPTSFIQLELRGCPKNEFCIGSTVKLNDGENIQTQQLILTRGYQSSVSPTLTFGLKNSTEKSSIHITWTNGETQVVNGINTNVKTTINYDPSGEPLKVKKTVGPSYVIGSVPVGTVNDFSKYPLIHKMYTFDYDQIPSEFSSVFPDSEKYQRVFCDDRKETCLVAISDLSDYPKTESLTLLSNNSTGKVERLEGKDLEELGVITDAAWSDINGDGIQDIIVSAEWSPIVILFGNSDGFEKMTKVSDDYGLWSAVHVADLNNDGIKDILAGNWGLNSQFSASPSSPLGIYTQDWDGNGKREPIYVKTIDGNEFPYVYKDDLMTQVPSLKRRFPSYKDYAIASIDDIFAKSDIEKSDFKMVDELASVVFYGSPDGTFKKETLPLATQYAPIYAFETLDVNGDGDLDIIYGGNESLTMEQLGRLMSHKSFVLINDAKGSFRVDRKYGTIKGEVRDFVVKENMKVEVTDRLGQKTIVSLND